ncbi:MAG: alanine--tRNA ligase [Clostridia bacterium]|nr:alanine--tRNA ligase [Clostridia bacterium]MDE6869856.1 alanine--tRNA ligase [Clostridia bacterium]
MKEIKSYELREKYLRFFEEKGHKIIPSASLIPENDPSVLFTTAGMHPLVPYLLGQKHPSGKRLCDVQKCVRTGDIDEVGDATHCTFFEMLGNWSLGDYFRKESINFSFEFLTKVLEIPVEKIAVTVFAGDEDCPRDEEAADTWASLGIPRERIFYLPKANNWWYAGATGPCGSDTEIFIDTGKEACGEHCDPSCDCGKWVEIWNNVFMEFNRNAEGKFEKLSQRNVDTGMGLERTICMLNGFKSVYETDLFAGAIAKIGSLAGKKYGENEEDTRAMRIIADHIRTATFLLGDERGVVPSNVDQGYVLRRLIRRSVRFARQLNIAPQDLVGIAKLYVEQYKDVYEELKLNSQKIYDELEKEIDKFSKTLEDGIKQLDKVLQFVKGDTLNGKTAFRLYDTYGFPIEMTVEICKEKGFGVDIEGYKLAQEEHIKKSQQGAEQKFKGGLADSSEMTTFLHTATHLLLASLKKVLGDEGIQQKGSNITPERLRFDFNFPRPLTAEEKQAVEDKVNEAIARDIPVVCMEMPIEEAREKNAVGVFGSRYGEIVKVYQIGDVDLQICGGPHAERTGQLGHFTLEKEQSSSAGIRRIRATIQPSNN